MPLRERSTSFASPGLAEYIRMDSNTIERISPAVTGALNWSNGSFVASTLLEKSTILDDASQPNSRGPKYVLHVKNQGAAMRATDAIIQYSPPAPNCKVRSLAYYQMLEAFPEPNRNGADWGGLISQMAANLNGSISTGCLALVTLKELGQTIKMVRNPFNLLKPTWRKAAGMLPAAELSKRAANVWLEGQYGWKSAWADVKTFAKTIGRLQKVHAETSEENPKFSFVDKEDLSWAGGGTFYSTSASLYSSHINNWNTGGIDYTLTSYADKRVDLRGTGTYRLSCRQNLFLAERMSSFGILLNALGLDLASLPSTLWEIVPYSFVIDWFIDWRRILGWSKAGRIYSRDVYGLTTSEKLEVEYDIRHLYPVGRSNYYWSQPWYYKRPTGFSNVPMMYGTGRWSSYERKPGGPGMDQVASGLITADLSVTQLASATSLLLQRAIS